LDTSNAFLSQVATARAELIECVRSNGDEADHDRFFSSFSRVIETTEGLFESAHQCLVVLSQELESAGSPAERERIKV
jgi:hypothetical protein